MKKLGLIVAVLFIGLFVVVGCQEEVADKKEDVNTEVNDKVVKSDSEIESEVEVETTTEEEEETEAEAEVESEVEEIDTANVEFYMQDQEYIDGDLVMKYPYFSSDTYYDGILNPIIEEDVEVFIDSLKEAYSNSMSGELEFEYAYFNHQIISIIYSGELYDEENEIYVNKVHTVNISLTTRDIVAFSDVFVVDEELVSDVKSVFVYNSRYSQMYLEDVDISQTLDVFYLDEDLLALMKEPDFSYILDDMSVTISLPMSRDYGEHIELSQKLEWIEYKMNKEHTAWTDYMFIITD